MAISRIEIGFPSKQISNDDVIALALEHSISSKLSEGELITRIGAFLSDCGAISRFWRDIGESPEKILNKTISKCLVGIEPTSIDVLLFCSATKYVAEPAHAAFIAQEHGLTPRLSFDISDGCMGWLTSLQVLDALGSSKECKRGLIVTHEFPMGNDGAIYPAAYTVANSEELNHKLPALTVGEGSTATLVDLESPAITELKRIESGRGANCCMMPYRNYGDFFDFHSQVFGVEEFYADFNSMSKIAAKESLILLKSFIGNESAHLFPHFYTNSIMRFASRIPETTSIHNHFPWLGNIVTSTIPTGIRLAKDGKKIDARTPVYAWCASAGIKVAAAKLALHENFCNQ